MRVLVMVLGLLLVSPAVAGELWQSSTTVNIFDEGGDLEYWMIRAAPVVLHAVSIPTPHTDNMNLSLYDSQGTATKPFATLRTGTVRTYFFDVWLSSGLTYSLGGPVPASGLRVTYFFR